MQPVVVGVDVGLAVEVNRCFLRKIIFYYRVSGRRGSGSF